MMMNIARRRPLFVLVTPTKHGTSEEASIRPRPLAATHRRRAPGLAVRARLVPSPASRPSSRDRSNPPAARREAEPIVGVFKGLRSAPRGRQRETTDALARADANVGHRASSDATTNATGRSSEEEEEEEEGRAEPSPAESSQRVSRCEQRTFRLPRRVHQGSRRSFFSFPPSALGRPPRVVSPRASLFARETHPSPPFPSRTRTPRLVSLHPRPRSRWPRRTRWRCSSRGSRCASIASPATAARSTRTTAAPATVGRGRVEGRARGRQRVQVRRQRGQGEQAHGRGRRRREGGREGGGGGAGAAARPEEEARKAKEAERAAHAAEVERAEGGGQGQGRTPPRARRRRRRWRRRRPGPTPPRRRKPPRRKGSRREGEGGEGGENRRRERGGGEASRRREEGQGGEGGEGGEGGCQGGRQGEKEALKAKKSAGSGPDKSPIDGIREKLEEMGVPTWAPLAAAGASPRSSSRSSRPRAGRRRGGIEASIPGCVRSSAFDGWRRERRPAVMRERARGARSAR